MATLFLLTFEKGGVMPAILALSLSIGGLGAVATWLALGPLSSILQIWVIFIAWGCYFASGANAEGLKGAMCGHALGAVLAGVALALVQLVPFGVATAPVWVGVMVFLLVYASQIEVFANIPAAVYGFACTAGLALVGADMLPKVLEVSLGNPVLIVIVSMIVGGVFGALSGRLSGILTK